MRGTKVAVLSPIHLTREAKREGLEKVGEPSQQYQISTSGTSGSVGKVASRLHFRNGCVSTRFACSGMGSWHAIHNNSLPTTWDSSSFLARNEWLTERACPLSISF